MINFTRAFDSSWERMMIILFRPFDLGKWCVIGFGAFLAGLFSGGNGANANPLGNFSNFGNSNSSSSSSTTSLQQLNSEMSNAFGGLQVGILVVIFLVVFAFLLAFVLALCWVGARGQFIFLDNVVRNRAVIAWPWNYYGRVANSLFFAQVIFMVVGLALFIPFLAVGLVLCWPLFGGHGASALGTERIVGIAIVGALYMVVVLVMAVVMYLFRQFGIPLMFRHGWTWWPAFRETLVLMQREPGNIMVFILLQVALGMATVVVSLIVLCGSCCLGALPYVGTVLLLPVLVYLRCFSLDCLAQFGPEYDVWTVDVPPVDPTTPASVSPPPQP